MVYIQQILVFLGICSILETTGQPVKYRHLTYRVPEKTDKQLAAEKHIAMLFDGFVKVNGTVKWPTTTTKTHKEIKAKRPEWISVKDKARRKIQISHRSDEDIQTEQQTTTLSAASGGVSSTGTAAAAASAGNGTQTGSGEDATGTPWGIEHELNKPWSDVVAKSHRGVTRFRLKLERTPIHNYVPPFKADSKMKTVCVKRSTIINEKKVKNWLSQERSFYSSLRSHKYDVNFYNLTFTKGNSEECHTPKYGSFHKYIDCTIKRHMRMESLIPKYPLHQIGNPKVA